MEITSNQIKEATKNIVRQGADLVEVSGFQKFGFRSQFVNSVPEIIESQRSRGGLEKRVQIHGGVDGSGALAETLNIGWRLEQSEISKALVKESKNLSEESDVGSLGILSLTPENKVVLFGGFATEERFKHRPSSNDFVALTFRDSETARKFIRMFNIDSANSSVENSINSLVILSVIEAALPDALPSRVGLQSEKKILTKSEAMDTLSRLIFPFLCIPGKLVISRKTEDSWSL